MGGDPRAGEFRSPGSLPGRVTCGPPHARRLCRPRGSCQGDRRHRVGGDAQPHNLQASGSAGQVGHHHRPDVPRQVPARSGNRVVREGTHRYGVGTAASWGAFRPAGGRSRLPEGCFHAVADGLRRSLLPLGATSGPASAEPGRSHRGGWYGTEADSPDGGALRRRTEHAFHVGGGRRRPDPPGSGGGAPRGTRSRRATRQLFERGGGGFERGRSTGAAWPRLPGARV